MIKPTRIVFFVITLAVVATAASAQQPQPPQQSPSSLALQITGIIAQWAQAIEALQKQNADLQTQLSAVTKERDDLKAAQKDK